MGVSLEVNPGEAIGLLGRNGVGKSTVLKTVMGLVQVTSGSISLNRTDITRTCIHERARLGMCYVPDNKGIFASLTAYENLQVAQVGSKRREKDIDWVMDLFPVLRERKKQVAGSLSGGEQQILAIARALVTKAKLLILDEISEGLAPEVVTTVLEVLRRLKAEEGTGVLLAEQNVRVCTKASDRVYVMLGGRIVFTGTVEEALASGAIDKYIKV
jgi:branched-chain amino acid transport system ATP-binding protein